MIIKDQVTNRVTFPGDFIAQRDSFEWVISPRDNVFYNALTSASNPTAGQGAQLASGMDILRFNYVDAKGVNRNTLLTSIEVGDIIKYSSVYDAVILAEDGPGSSLMRCHVQRRYPPITVGLFRLTVTRPKQVLTPVQLPG